MGKFFTTLAALLILAGCYNKKITPITPIAVYYDGIYKLEYEGHEYLWNSSGGIIHSDSCPCWEEYKTEDGEVEFD